MGKKRLINPAENVIPDAGMGNYIEGYYGRRNTVGTFGNILVFLMCLGMFLFSLVAFLYNPEVPFFLLVVFLLLGCQIYFGWKLYSSWNDFLRVYVYKNGFLWQDLNCMGSLINEKKICFDDISSISLSKTAHFTNGVYNKTSVDCVILDKNGNNVFTINGNYNNRYEQPDKYNTFGYAIYAIIDRWDNIAIDRFHRELDEKGYGTFEDGFTQVGHDFLRRGDCYVDTNEGFEYNFAEGFLHLYPKSSEREDFLIPINGMNNYRVFLLAIDQLLGIH